MFDDNANEDGPRFLHSSLSVLLLHDLSQEVETVFFLRDGYSDTLFELMRVRIFYIYNNTFVAGVYRSNPTSGECGISRPS